MSAADRERSMKAHQDLADDAIAAERQYRDHVLGCGVCEHAGYAEAMMPEDVRKLLPPEKRRKEVHLWCNDGIRLWSYAIETRAVQKHARAALNQMGLNIPEPERLTPLL